MKFQLDHPQSSPPPSVRDYATSLFVILRLSLTLLGHHVLIHRVYVGIMSYNADLLSRLDFSTLTAVGIFRVLDFSAMYAPTYGISQTVQKLDGYEPVPYPTCLAHVYHYSACWRLFDVGFYNYVKRYIYQPVISIMGGGFLLGQLPAMVLVYAFVCVYHGATPALFRWTAFNFTQVLLESMLVKMASNSSVYASIMVIKRGTEYHYEASDYM